MRLDDLDSSRWTIPRPAATNHHQHHHLHPHAMSRRAFMGTVAGAAGAALGAGLVPGVALAAKPPNSAPKPTTSTFSPAPGLTFHISFFGDGIDPSTITDFNGFVGVAEVQGTGKDNAGNSLIYDTDMRFMSGVYVGVDGAVHKGTFGFV
jgi:hypothetical protein